MSHEDHKLVRFLTDCLRSAPPVAPASLYQDSQTRWVLDQLKAISQPNVLDYGCGNCRLLGGILHEIGREKTWSYCGADIQQYDSAALNGLEGVNEFTAKGAIRFTSTSALRREAPGTFDVAVMMNVLHELPLADIAIAFADIRRALKPEGFLFLVDMCLLPEGEPGAICFYPEDLEQLFGKHGDHSFTSKSGIPIVASIISRTQIPIYPKGRALSRSLLMKKRTDWASLATRPELNPKVVKKMIGRNDEVFALGFLSFLVANATFRLDEDREPIPGRSVDNAAIHILELFHDLYEREQRHVMFDEIYNALAPSHDYATIAEALTIMTDPMRGWFRPQPNEPTHTFSPMERYEWFEDRYGLQGIREHGLVPMIWSTFDANMMMDH